MMTLTNRVERLVPMFRRHFDRFWGVAGAVSVRTKILGIVLALVLIFERKGISFGEASEKVFSQYGMSPVIYPELSALVLQWAAGIVLAVSLVLAIYPAWKASRLVPVEALRHA